MQPEHVRTVNIRVRADNLTLGQGARPGATASSGGTQLYVSQSRDLWAGFGVYDIYPSDTVATPASRLVVLPNESFFHQLTTNLVREVDPAFANQALLRLMPYTPQLLLEAWDQAGTIRWIGQESFEGKQHDVITYANKMGHQVALFFDSRSGRLSKSETVESHAQFGDHVAEVIFGDFRTVGKLSIAHSITSRVAGRANSEVRLETVQLNGEFDTTLVVRPEDATEGPPLNGPSAPTSDLEVNELSDGVYMIPNAAPNYNVMFVEQNDHIMILEAPISPDISRAVMKSVHNTIPGKPIRYAAITHHHFDHTGGLWPYIAEGVAIITTSGNVDFLKQVARAPRSLDGENSNRQVIPKIEVMKGRRAFDKGGPVVELYEVGPNPHVDEILIAYVPSNQAHVRCGHLQLQRKGDTSKSTNPITRG